jgi:hypothetical protein
MLARLLRDQYVETLAAAQAADDLHITEAKAGTPKGFLPPSGARLRALLPALTSAIDVAQTLERSAFAGDHRAQSELVAYARQLCADSVAEELARRFAWAAQGAQAKPAPKARPRATSPRDSAWDLVALNSDEAAKASRVALWATV